MHSFLIGLQFLTRIRLVRQTEWTAEDFGRSTRFFPLVGLVLGICYALFAWLLLYAVGMRALTAALLLVLPLLLTGGLHADGFMDTADGVFSGRDRERKLEIMKDSRVGAFGVVSFVMLMFVQYALISDMHPLLLIPALFVMPVIGRFAMVLSVACFPYAREDGMGKTFADMAEDNCDCCPHNNDPSPAVGLSGSAGTCAGNRICASLLPADHACIGRCDRRRLRCSYSSHGDACPFCLFSCINTT